MGTTTATPRTYVGDPVERAFAAYFRAGRGDCMDQPANTSGLVDHAGREYVVLHNVNGTLAVFWVMGDGGLKRLKSWPAALNE